MTERELASWGQTRENTWENTWENILARVSAHLKQFVSRLSGGIHCSCPPDPTRHPGFFSLGDSIFFFTLARSEAFVA